LPSVFISYTRADFAYAERLWKHLQAFRAGGGDVFFDRERLNAGDVWSEQIDSALQRADLFVLLVSADFIGSDFCMNTEVMTALKRSQPDALPARNVKVHTVVIGDCVQAGLPKDAPGGRHLPALHAAGPFDANNRLVAMKQLAEAHQEQAWRRIAEQIHDHFGLPHPGAKASAGEKCETPDASSMLAECNRGALVKAVGTLAGDHPLSVLLTEGHRLDEALLKRIARDLGPEPYSLQAHAVFFKTQRVANCVSQADFDNALRAHAHDPERDTPLRTANDILGWVESARYQVLLIGHTLGGQNPAARRADARLSIAGAAQWLKGLPERSVAVVVVLSVDSPADPAAQGWLGKLKGLMPGGGSTLSQELASHAARYSLGWAVQPLGDYLPGEVDEWMNHPNIRPVLSRNRDVANRLANDLASRAQWAPSELLKTCWRLAAN
jgi:TIR domain